MLLYFFPTEHWTTGLCQHRGKNKVELNKKGKLYVGFHIPKILQILKRCARQSHQA